MFYIGLAASGIGGAAIGILMGSTRNKRNLPLPLDLALSMSMACVWGAFMGWVFQ